MRAGEQRTHHMSRGAGQGRERIQSVMTVPVGIDATSSEITSGCPDKGMMCEAQDPAANRARGVAAPVGLAVLQAASLGTMLPASVRFPTHGPPQSHDRQGTG